MNKRAYLVVILLAMAVALSSCSSNSYSSQATDGFASLDQLNPENRIVDLAGEWEFYWNQLLAPEDIEAHLLQRKLVAIPHSWDDLGYPLQGYATYRLKTELEPDTIYGLELNDIATAYNLYINGEQAATRGKVGRKDADSVSKLGSEIVIFNTEQKQVEIVLQVSSFSYYKAGISGKVRLGGVYQLQQSRYKRIALALILSGILLSMAAYHLLFFIFRKKELSNLYFSIASFIVFIQTIFEESHFFSFLFPRLNLQTEERIQTILLILILPVVIASIYNIFKTSFHKPIVYFFYISSFLLAVAVIFTPFGASNPVWPIYGLLVLLGTAFLIYALVKNIRARNSNAFFLLTGTVCLAAAVAHDFLVDYRILQSYKLFSVGWVIFLVMVSTIITNQFSASFKKVEQLSVEINKKNIDLKQAYLEVEKRVKNRTSQLNLAKKRLEKANEQLKKDKQMFKVLSITDGLTGLFNHNHIIGELKREINRSKRYGNLLSVIMMDIDHFKTINDIHGHQNGDRVLSEIGNIIKETLRKADIAGRYGGEEFLIIMPETGLDSAYLLGERLREKVADHRWKIGNLKVNVSGGVAQHEYDMSYGVLLSKADKLLYKAKQEGRNRVER
ncbi:MAG: diguanylate cyclase [Actinomycetia bacterium]|nr:diguanylate cyclase [Actinomycetes bacterium]